jgi:hypothetical protein
VIQLDLQHERLQVRRNAAALTRRARARPRAPPR